MRNYFASEKVMREIASGKLSKETLTNLNLLKMRCLKVKVRFRGLGAFLPSNWLKALPVLTLSEERPVKKREEEDIVCPYCGRKLAYLAYNDAREAVCPYCGSVLEEYSLTFVRVPDELRPIVPGFEPSNPEIERRLDRDVPDHPLTLLTRTFLREVASLRDLMRPEVASRLHFDEGDFDEMTYDLARAVEKRFWELMRIVVPPAFIPLCDECPPTITPCVRMMVALIDTVFTERVWDTVETAFVALQGAYSACVATHALRAFIPVLGIGLKAKINERDASFLLSRDKSIPPSRDAEITRCLAFTQAFIMLAEARILSDERALSLGTEILKITKEAYPFDVRYIVAQMNDEERMSIRVEDRGDCKKYVDELLTTFNLKRLLTVKSVVN